MKQIVENKKKDIIKWINWLSTKWNDYEPFEDFQLGDNPQQVAENFFLLNQTEFAEFLENFDSDDLETFDQFYKLAETELYVFKIIKNKINFLNKVRYVDFNKRRLIEEDN